MTILFYSDVDAPEPWRKLFARELPEMPFRVWPDGGGVEEIRYALVWKPPLGLLKRLPRLKAILSLGAGVDHLLRDPDLPREVPLVRIVDGGMAQQMTEYAIYGVLHFHRSMDRYAELQRKGEWRQLPAVPAAQRSIGVMGLGVLGGHFVRQLLPLGFKLRGWSRSPRDLPGVTTFHGAERLAPFLAGTEILVNYLPLTPHTRGILDARTFAMLPRGACVVNLARGGHLVDEDLLRALDDGQLGGAMLDVFHEEPLPREHQFWRHPRIFVTPHIGAAAIPELMESQVVQNIRRIERGEPPLGIVDLERGY